MEYYNIGGYEQRIEKGEPVCTCVWGSLYPDAWSKGNKVCKHIIELMAMLHKNETFKKDKYVRNIRKKETKK